MKKKNIGILSEHFINWGGGIDFIRLILNSLTSIQGKNKNEINIYIFIPKQSTSKIKIKNKLKVIINSIINKKYQLQKIIPKQSIINSFISINNSIKIIFYNDSETDFLKLVQKHKIDFIIPAFSPMSDNFPIPWIGYIYDFQHKYYPEFFSKEEIELRDRQFISMLNKAKTIIVNARAVKNDVNKFYGETKYKKIIALPFCPVLNEEFFKTNICIKKYNLPNEYFMVSNQFWKHKDHKTAFKAFKLFLENQKNKDIALVCTGQTHDFRFPNYFDELIELINELGLDKYIYILGYIPKIDQLQILKKCIAIVQPTLFEGGPGGFSVFESVAYGIPSIVSDISVNKEIEDETVNFFKTGSEIDLSQKMLSVYKKDRYQYSMDELVIKNNKSLLKMGQKILNIVN